MSKVKVIEIDVAKLDPNAVHLIVFNKNILTKSEIHHIITQLKNLGVKAAFAMSEYPQDTLRVYEIPREVGNIR